MRRKILTFKAFLKMYINLSSFQWQKLAPAAIDTSSVEVANFIFTFLFSVFFTLTPLWWRWRLYLFVLFCILLPSSVEVDVILVVFGDETAFLF